MLQRDLGAGDEPIVRPAAELPDEFSALGDTRRADRVAFGYEAARRVDDAAATVRDVARADHFVGSTGSAEAEGVERDEFVGGEAIVEFADFDLLGVDVGFG